MTIEERVDSVCKWNNPGLRAVVLDALREHVAELEAESARLKALLPLADDAVMKSILVVENLKAENARLRKVVEEGLPGLGMVSRWLKERREASLKGGISMMAERDAFFCTTIRAYQEIDAYISNMRLALGEKLPQNCHKGTSLEEREVWPSAPFVTDTEGKPDGE